MFYNEILKSFRFPFSVILPLCVLLCTSSLYGQTGSNSKKWVGSWSTAPQLVESGNMPPSPGLTNNSLRQVVRVSIGGDTIRLRLSNEFSTSSVIIKSIQIALSTGGSTINVSTNKELKFNGSSEVTMNAGATVTSDPIAFNLTARMDVAITIYYGQTSSTVSGHPGSRTTSYLLAGNTTTVTDFTSAVSTDHWYNINAIDVLAPSTASCVAILGNSITDGRGSTTNQQNRWPDILSEELLKNPATQQVGVLNLGIGGNSVLSGGLGPTAISRYERDILNQSGVRYAIIFIGVNDIGGVGNEASATTKANDLIAAFKQMIKKAHANNIRVYGATILPFGGSSYYNTYSEKCRSSVNQWIRTKGNYDGYIDFDRSIRSTSDTLKLVSAYQNDGLHPDAAGYKQMGESIDLSLFALGDTIFPELVKTGVEYVWFEAERFVKAGSNYTIVSDATVSNGKYITVTDTESTAAAPTETINLLSIPFKAAKDSLYYVFGRVNCPTYDDDSYWIKMDNGTYYNANGLKTGGWEWMKLNSYTLTKGSHTLTIGYRENGASLDKICISNDEDVPSGMGGLDSLILGVRTLKSKKGYALRHIGNSINFEIPIDASVSFQMNDMLGVNIKELAGMEFTAGMHTVEFNDSNLPKGMYICIMKAGNYSLCQKLVLRGK